MKQAERPGLRRWTRDEYARLIDHGFLDEDDPIELLDGLLPIRDRSGGMMQELLTERARLV